MEMRAVLARCTAHGAQFGGIRGGSPELTPADVAHGVGRVKDPLGRDLVLYLWADHAELEPAVMRGLLLRAAYLAADNGWRVRQPGTLRGLIRAVLTEMRVPRHCGRCNSSGARAGKPCTACLGEGGRPYTDRMRARAGGLAWETFRDWAGRYADVYAVIEDCERAAIKDIRRALT